MRRISMALAVMSAAVAGCSMGSKPTAPAGNGSAKGEQGVFFYVNIFAPPIGGYVQSADDSIDCGATGVTVNNAVTPPQYVYALGTHNTCGTAGQTRVNWNDVVVLTATANAGKAFLGWAGDCSGTAPTCTLSKGADKTVVAIFGVPGSGHPNFLDPAVHGPAAKAGVLNCASCHGDQYQGQGIAPSCTKCHGDEIKPELPTAKTGLVAAITGVNPATNAVTFTLKDTKGANIDVTGATSANWPMPVTMAIVNFGIDANGNALPLKADTGAAPNNPATVSPFAQINSPTITSGTVPSTAPVTLYPSGAATQGAAATVCTTAAPCTCTSANPCNLVANFGFGYHAPVAPATVGTYGACTPASLCICDADTPCAPTLPYSTASGTLSYAPAAGQYTFTFAVSPFAAGVSGNTHVAFLATYRRENMDKAGYTMNGTSKVVTAAAGIDDGTAYTAVNVPYYFNSVTGAPVATKRDIVSDASCAKCHDGFKAPVSVQAGFHSSARIGAEYCNICHYEGRGTNGFADSATFVHRIHKGKDLTHVTTGTKTTGYQMVYAPGTKTSAPVSCSATAVCTCTTLSPCSDFTFHGIEASYPQNIENCTECHDASTASKAGQFNTRPSIAACGACHDQLATTFLPIGSALAITNHPASSPGTRTNADCYGCHGPATTHSAIGHTLYQNVPPDSTACLLANNATGCNSNTNIAYVSTNGALPPGASRISYVLQSVGTWTDTSVTPNVQRPQMVFKLQKDGVDVNFGTYDATTNPELIPGFVGAPSAYWVWAAPQDGIAAPVDYNVSSSLWLKQCWRSGTNCNMTRDAATGFYTIQSKAAVVSAASTMLTGGVGYTYNPSSSQPLTQLVGQPFPVTPVNVTFGTVAFGAATAQTCSVATPCVIQSGGLIVPTKNVWAYAASATPRRVIVANEKCDACHGRLGVEPTFHAGQRNDAPTCAWCHKPNQTSGGWSASSATFIHGIHGAEVRGDLNPFKWHAACPMGSTYSTTNGRCEVAGVEVAPSAWYPEVEYPGKLSDCSQCHVNNSFNLVDASADLGNMLWSTVASGTAAIGDTLATSPDVSKTTIYGAGWSYAAATGVVTQAVGTTLVSSPIAAVCYSCHADAKAHITSSGGHLYESRASVMVGSAFPAEACMACHGPGGIEDISLVHQP